MNSFNRKIAEKFGPQRAKPKKFGCLGNFLHGALRPCIFIGFRRFEEPQDYSLRNHRENSRRAVSLTKIIHPITFWQRFFFLWLRFFLFGRSKKKEMNKTTPYTTGYFAYAQYDATSFRKLFVFEAAPKRNKQPPRRESPHPQRLFAFAQSDRRGLRSIPKKAQKKWNRSSSLNKY